MSLSGEDVTDVLFCYEDASNKVIREYAADLRLLSFIYYRWKIPQFLRRSIILFCRIYLRILPDIKLVKLDRFDDRRYFHGPV